MNVKPQLSDELRRVPKLAKVLAGLVPVCVIAITVMVVFLRAKSGPAGAANGGPPVGIAALLLVLVPVVISGVLALWVLLVGYVYSDAGRRGMSRLLWMLVVIFMPSGLGFVLYFILRYPVPAECPV